MRKTSLTSEASSLAQQLSCFFLFFFSGCPPFFFFPCSCPGIFFFFSLGFSFSPVGQPAVLPFFSLVHSFLAVVIGTLVGNPFLSSLEVDKHVVNSCILFFFFKEPVLPTLFPEVLFFPFFPPSLEVPFSFLSFPSAAIFLMTDVHSILFLFVSPSILFRLPPKNSHPPYFPPGKNCSSRFFFVEKLYLFFSPLGNINFPPFHLFPFSTLPTPPQYFAYPSLFFCSF